MPQKISDVRQLKRHQQALEALTYRVVEYKQLAPTSAADIQNELQRGRCVAFSIPVFNS